jgi:hypothetical protein
MLRKKTKLQSYPFPLPTSGLDAEYKKYKEQYIDNRIKQLLFDTQELEPIARIYIIDAVLSNRFSISLQEAKQTWLKEIEAVHKIHESIIEQNKHDNIPRVYQCARFALHVLKHLMQRGLTYTMLSYSLTARNFIVGLVATSQCVCLSYSLYVQSLVNYFGYDDYTSDCRIPGHIFTMTNLKDHPESKPRPKTSSDEDKEHVFEIGFDAGYFKNRKIEVTIWSQDKNIDVPTLKKYLDWDNDFFSLFIQHTHPNCLLGTYWGKAGDKQNRNSRTAGNLWNESFYKKTFSKMIRTQFILLEILSQLNDLKINRCITAAEILILYEIYEYQTYSKILTLDTVPIYQQIKKLQSKLTPLANAYHKDKDLGLYLLLNGTASLEILCSRNLVQLFQPWVKPSLDHSLDQILIDIHKDYVKLIQLEKGLTIELDANKNNCSLIISTRFFIKDIQHKLDLFSVCYVQTTQLNWQDQLTNLLEPECKVYYSLVRDFNFTLPSFMIQVIESSNMPNNLVIVTYDYPKTQQKLDQLKTYYQKKQIKFEARVSSIRAGTFVSQRHQKSRVKFVSDLKNQLTFHDFMHVRGEQTLLIQRRNPYPSSEERQAILTNIGSSVNNNVEMENSGEEKIVLPQRKTRSSSRTKTILPKKASKSKSPARKKITPRSRSRSRSVSRPKTKPKPKTKTKNKKIKPRPKQYTTRAKK